MYYVKLLFWIGLGVLGRLQNMHYKLSPKSTHTRPWCLCSEAVVRALVEGKCMQIGHGV